MMNEQCNCVLLTSIITDDSHLSVLVAALRSVHQWFPLGIHLGLSCPTLKIIEQNERGQVERCRIEMLDVWLKGPEEKRSKHYLQLALQQLSPEEHQVIIHNMLTTTVLHVEEFIMLHCKCIYILVL